jgi:aspartate kinase
MIVQKFGGSSVGSAESIRRVLGIVRGQLDRRPVVVVSAMGKTTRHLLEGADAAAAGDLALATDILAELRDYHRREASPLLSPAGRERLDEVLARDFGGLRQRIEVIAAAGRVTPQAADAMAGQGELLSSAILALALDHAGIASRWIDCREVLITDDAFTRARPLYEETEPRLRAALQPCLEAGQVPVLGGYVGSTREGIPTTLGKEGSDFSAAIVGAALGVEEVQIWTDVEGLLTADPRVVPGARLLRTLSFGEALELACSGAKKPHYGTLGPARRAGVPIRILNSWNPRPGAEEDVGTLIGRRSNGAPGIRSITWRPNVRRITVRGNGSADGLLAGFGEVCERFRPSLLVLAEKDGEIELALDRQDRLFEIHFALSRLGEVRLAPGGAVVTLVSDDLASHPDLTERALDAARELDPRLVTRGVAAPCIRCLVREEEAAATVAALHERIFGDRPGEAIG